MGNWTTGGGQFCLSSPTAVCGQAGFAHGMTVVPVLTSSTFDLGTWSFNATGDYEGTIFYNRTNNGGLSNTNTIYRGTFVGAAIPALPLVGFGALAVSLAVLGGRSLLGRK